MAKSHAETRPVTLTPGPLSARDVVDVAHARTDVVLSPESREHVERSHDAMLRVSQQSEAVYGINTGFGSLARTRVPSEQLHDLQRNLIRSHAAGVGEPLREPVTRAMLCLLAASLARGRSGVRVELVQGVIDLLNSGVTPVVPAIGSVGASGDLAPLAHATLALMGEGEAWYCGERLPGSTALERAGLKPIELQAKEGLALINGTHMMAARAVILLDEWERVLDAALVAAAMCIDACKASHSYLDAEVHAARAQPECLEVADTLRALLDGSQIAASHEVDDGRVQDPYSYRCCPYVLGSSLSLTRYVKLAIERELGAVTDNPLVLTDDGDRVVSAGNFHGMPIALPLDTLPLAVTHVAGMAERRVYFLLAARDAEMQLKPYLTPQPGVESGFMIAQYTAAACCNEIITQCVSSTASNIPTSAGIEDYNSFGPRAAEQAARAVERCRTVVAIELLCAAEGIDRHRPLKSGVGVERAHELVRSAVEPLTHDRPPGPDIERLSRLIENGAFSPLVNQE